MGERFPHSHCGWDLDCCAAPPTTHTRDSRPPQLCEPIPYRDTEPCSQPITPVVSDAGQLRGPSHSLERDAENLLSFQDPSHGRLRDTGGSAYAVARDRTPDSCTLTVGGPGPGGPPTGPGFQGHQALSSLPPSLLVSGMRTHNLRPYRVLISLFNYHINTTL